MARKESGLTQSYVAEYIGVSQASVGRWEKGQDECSLGALHKLSVLYNENLDYLITGQRIIGTSNVPEWLRPHIQAMESLSEFDSGRLEGRIAGWLESLTANNQPEETSEQGEENQIAVAGAPRSRDGTR